MKINNPSPQLHQTPGRAYHIHVQCLNLGEKKNNKPEFRTDLEKKYFVRLPKKVSISQVPGIEMEYIAVGRLMLCVNQAVTSLKIGQNLLI